MTTDALHRRSGALTGLRSFTVMERYSVLGLTGREPCRTGSYGGEFRGVEGGRKFFIGIYPAKKGVPLATLADAGALTFVATLLTHRLNLDQPLAPTLTFSSADCLRALGRPAGGHQHRLLAAQFARLANTVMSTDLRGQHDCERILTRAEHMAGQWHVDVSFLLAREVQEHRILQIDPRALHLRGLERRLYGWGRTYCGGPAGSYTLALKRAFALSGSTDQPRRFRHALRTVVANNRVPGVDLSLSGDGADAALTLIRRGAEQQSSPRIEKARQQVRTFEELFGPETPELVRAFGLTHRTPRARVPVDIEDLPPLDGP